MLSTSIFQNNTYPQLLITQPALLFGLVRLDHHGQQIFFVIIFSRWLVSHLLDDTPLVLNDLVDYLVQTVHQPVQLATIGERPQKVLVEQGKDKVQRIELANLEFAEDGAPRVGSKIERLFVKVFFFFFLEIIPVRRFRKHVQGQKSYSVTHIKIKAKARPADNIKVEPIFQ